MKNFFIINLIFSLIFLGLVLDNSAFAESKGYKNVSRTKDKATDTPSVKEDSDDSDDLFDEDEDIDGAENVSDGELNGWQEARKEDENTDSDEVDPEE